MKLGDLVRLRKSHPAVKQWRKRKWLAIGQWAEAGSPLLLLGKCTFGDIVSDTRWDVLGPGGELASFDDYLFTTRGMK